MNSENKKINTGQSASSGSIVIGGNVSGSNIVIGDNNRINVERTSVIKDIEIEIALQNKKRLFDSISQSLSSSEISKLSFELGIDYDKIVSNSKTETISRLLEIIEKQGVFPKLLQFLKATRPDVFDTITARY